LKEKQRHRGRRDRERIQRKRQNEELIASAKNTNSAAENASSVPENVSETNTQSQSYAPSTRSRARERKPRRVKRGESLEDEIGEFGRRGRRASINYSEIVDFERLAEAESNRPNQDQEDLKHDSNEKQQRVDLNENDGNQKLKLNIPTASSGTSSSVLMEHPPLEFAHSMPATVFMNTTSTPSPNVGSQESRLSAVSPMPRGRPDNDVNEDDTTEPEYSPSIASKSSSSTRNRAVPSSRAPTHHSDREHENFRRRYKDYSKTLSPRSVALAQRAIEAMTGSSRRVRGRGTRLGLTSSTGTADLDANRMALATRSRSGSGYLFHRGSVPAFLPSDEEAIHSIGRTRRLQDIFVNPNNGDGPNAGDESAPVVNRPHLFRRDSWA
jgi:hypothetical protein